VHVEHFARTLELEDFARAASILHRHFA
jgi:hypothetical protein